MKNRCAVVIVYDGRPIEGEEHRRVAEAFMRETDCVESGPSITVNGLGPEDIAKGILAKALVGEHFYSDSTPVEKQIDVAAKLVGERFANAIIAGPTTLAAEISAVYVSIKLAGVSRRNLAETALVNSIELLAEEGSYAAISPNIRKKYHITKTLIETIKYIHDNICRGRIVTIG